MPLAGEMHRLCDRLAYDHDRCWDAVHAIRENALRVMSNIRDTHAKRAEETSRRIHDFNASRSRMTAEQRHRLTEFHDNLHRDVSEFVGDLQQAHRDRAFQISEHIHDLGSTRMKMGAEQARMLIDFHDNLVESVGEFVGELREAHDTRARDMSQHIHDMGEARKKMGEEQELMLAEFHADLHDSVEDFVSDLQEAHKNRAHEVNQELHDLGTSRKKMSTEQQRRLAKEHARLEATVNQTRKELRTDIKRAHQVWTEFAAKSPHRGAKGGAVQMKPKPAPTARPAVGGGAATEADDLTVIPGIGPSRQVRLNEMGIHSFSDLAQATEARLRDSLGQSARLVDVGKWIAEAKKRIRL